MDEPALQIIRPGLFTTVQDLGRSIGEELGVPAGGAMDPRSLQAANILVGNARSAACLEITLSGPVLRFLGDCRIAVCGAVFAMELDGSPAPANSVWNARDGQSLTFGRCLNGARAYLAISGGFAVPEVLGSRSTYTPGEFGGLAGRCLCEGDVLHRELAQRPELRHSIATSIRFAGQPPVQVRALRGPQYSWFGSGATEAFWSTEFTVSARSDRSGMRLGGASIPSNRATSSMISEPIPLGTVQVSPDGAPTILTADRPTIGGYPKIVTVICPDMPAIAQCRPGDTLRFVEVTLDEAYEAAHQTERELRTLAWAVAHLL